ncbi:MAG TPA: alkaline phosphatase family protein [Anaerolineales bacterium]|nr:alkaline phosphatase family protein [Anaerolineales bacterium]
MNKVILILSDGLRYDTAVEGMGFLGHLVEAKKASRYKVLGELPSMSRPMYETIHTGLTTSDHGIVTNSTVRLSDKPNIFGIVKDAGGVTAAVAYSWFSELYNRVPYNTIEDREVDDPVLCIEHGRFYTEDDYPDIEVFRRAALLVRRFQPNYLLVHPMGMDYHGEKYGSDSQEYRYHAIEQDMWLVPFIVEWRSLGYHLLITADHGMSKDGVHGGTTLEMREVPLYMLRHNVEEKGDTNQTVSQLQIAPTIVHLMGIPIPETMKRPPISESISPKTVL